MSLDPRTAAAYGGVTNIDDNFGRLMKKLDELGLRENTLVMFLTDNGSCQGSVREDRYMAGLRGLKGYVYEGGIRVPCFMRFPEAFSGSCKIDRIAAHIDIAPTILDVCGLSLPQDTTVDGVSLMPLLRDQEVDWPDRTLFFQWHSMEEGDGKPPTLYRAFTAFDQRYKLVQAHDPGQLRIVERYGQLVEWQNRGAEQMPQNQPNFELFDVTGDPGEHHDVAGEYPEIARQLKMQYEAWFERVTRDLGNK
jgi:arylsulfatase A-like enzyme